LYNCGVSGDDLGVGESLLESDKTRGFNESTRQRHEGSRKKKILLVPIMFEWRFGRLRNEGPVGGAMREDDARSLRPFQSRRVLPTHGV